MKLNVFGHVFGNLGYNVHTRGFIEGLQANDIDVKTIPYDMQPSGETSRMLIESIKKKPNYNSPSVCLNYGNDMLKFFGTKRIGYSVWETTRIPEDWISSLNKLDDVWTVSKFCKKAFEDSGVEKDVKIVHEGVDTSIFNKYVDKIPRRPEDESKFLFLSIFKWEKRKSPDILIEAFSEEFENEKDVLLLLQCYNPFLQEFNPFEAIMNMNVKVAKKLQILPPLQKRTELARLYRTVDCFVLPTKGESWGLPAIESLACGVPVITTNWGGTMEFMKSDYGWLIDVDHMEMPDDGMFFKPYKDNEWAVPSKKNLREHMRYAYEHREECKKKGNAAYDYVDENFNWGKSTEPVKELLKE
jgi:hypothetical protein